MGISRPCCFANNFASGERNVKDVTTSAARIDSTDGMVANVDHDKSAGRWNVPDTAILSLAILLIIQMRV